MRHNPNPERVEDVELTATEAAAWFAVSGEAVRQWVFRGKLHPCGYIRQNGRTIHTFRFGDLCHAAYGDDHANLRRTLPDGPERIP